MLFNNGIYGLTKGQYSSTSQYGKVTPSTPYGSFEHPVNPIKLALTADCTFIARSIDIDNKGLHDILLKAVAHKGTCFIEILQDCNIYNKDNILSLRNSLNDFENILFLKHGSGYFFGKNFDKCIYLDKNYEFSIKNKSEFNSHIVHDITKDSIIHYLLSDMSLPNFPVPIGIFRSIKKTTYEESYFNSKSKKYNDLIKDEIYNLV